MRAALGLGGIAALSAIAATIVSPPRPETVVLAAPQAQTTDPATIDAPTDPPTDAALETPTVLYVQLQPGETAPPGATVIPA